jgi:hypothetical protein
MTEYGAMLPMSQVVCMRSDSLLTMEAWINDYSTRTPLELVSRENEGDTHGRWVRTHSPVELTGNIIVHHP